MSFNRTINKINCCWIRWIACHQLVKILNKTRTVILHQIWGLKPWSQLQAKMMTSLLVWSSSKIYLMIRIILKPTPMATSWMATSNHQDLQNIMKSVKMMTLTSQQEVKDCRIEAQGVSALQMDLTKWKVQINLWMDFHPKTLILIASFPVISHKMKVTTKTSQ